MESRRKDASREPPPSKPSPICVYVRISSSTGARPLANTDLHRITLPWHWQQQPWGRESCVAAEGGRIPSMKLVLGCLVSLIFLFVQMQSQPFKDQGDDALAIFTSASRSTCCSRAAVGDSGTSL